MELAFPSKLTDYTAVGLPLLICGPEYCSAVQWGRENAGVAEIACDEQLSDLTPAVERLMGDPEHCLQLARAAIDVGKRYFSFESAQQILEQALLRQP